MTAPTTRVELAAFLGRVAEVCKEAVAAHIVQTQSDLRFQRQVLFSLAALESAAARAELEHADIRLVREAASDAAAVCRTERPDDAMHAVAACLDEVTVACDALFDTPSHDQSRPWRRFLFADADVSVLRERRRWRVRGDAGETVNTFLDIALGEIVPLAGHRIGELTVKILDWYAHEDTLDRA